jgi:hypothetical protein
VKTWRLLLTLALLSAWSNATAQPPRDVALADLIARPAVFHGQEVRTHGFLTLGLENSALWIHETDYRAGRFDRAIWVDGPRGASAEHPLNGRRAYVSGRFGYGPTDGLSHGHLGLTVAAIEVSRLEADPVDVDRPRPWINDPIFVILASLGMLGLSLGVISFGLKTFARRQPP